MMSCSCSQGTEVTIITGDGFPHVCEKTTSSVTDFRTVKLIGDYLICPKSSILLISTVGIYFYINCERITFRCTPHKWGRFAVGVSHLFTVLSQGGPI